VQQAGICSARDRSQRQKKSTEKTSQLGVLKDYTAICQQWEHNRELRRISPWVLAGDNFVVSGAERYSMTNIPPIDISRMTEHQRAWFLAEYEHARRDEVAGVLLALFLGSFGIHHFYLRRNGLGLLYLIFSWTGIPGIVGIIEAFFMPGRVRQFNAEQANFIAGQILGGSSTFYPPPIYPTFPCPACGGAVTAGATFCPHCGATLAAKG
jgi:TM2 domain-containing membrane protein YozV